MGGGDPEVWIVWREGEGRRLASRLPVLRATRIRLADPRLAPAAVLPILTSVSPQLNDPAAAATLSEAERRTVRRFVALLSEALGPQLRAVWLYGSRARGEAPGPDSDVDLLVIVTGDVEGGQRLALELSEAAALAEGEDPFSYSVHVYDSRWLRRRREIESFFIGEVDRDKLVLAGSPLETSEAP